MIDSSSLSIVGLLLRGKPILIKTDTLLLSLFFVAKTQFFVMKLEYLADLLQIQTNRRRSQWHK